MLKLPESVLLSLAVLRESLLHEDYGRHLELLIVLHVVQLHQIDGIEVETEDCVVVVEGLAEMRVDDEGMIVGAEVLDSCNLDLDHLEFLLGCTSTYVEIVIDVLNV
jgi:hypothetical protein